MTRAALLVALSLTACHPARDAPGAVTPEQDQQLNDAAAALDANSMAANSPANGERP